MFEAHKPAYSLDALEPHLSKKAMDLHYNKHHQGYANKLNQLVKGTRYSDMDLGKVINQTAWVHGPESHRASKSQDERAQYIRDLTIYNNAAQVWNHDFYWQCMSPNGGGKPSGGLAKAIKKDLGNFEKQLLKVATDHFGSGWVWLIYDDGLALESYDNAITPLSFEYPPQENILMCIDVWEHSYYPDFSNNRAQFVKDFTKHLINWDFIEERFENMEGK